jgi:hypothetical protein
VYSGTLDSSAEYCGSLDSESEDTDEGVEGIGESFSWGSEKIDIGVIVSARERGAKRPRSLGWSFQASVNDLWLVEMGARCLAATVERKKTKDTGVLDSDAVF